MTDDLFDRRVEPQHTKAELERFETEMLARTMGLPGAVVGLGWSPWLGGVRPAAIDDEPALSSREPRT